VLLKDVFPHVQYEQYRRGLCLLDPYGLDLNWEVIKEAGRMKSIDMFLNFPICDMNRNVLWHKRDEVDISDIKRMNAYWGDDSWTQVAYSPFPNLLGEIIEFKSDNNTIAKAFKERLIKAAGFKNVPKPIPMKNSNNSTIYYLFFASQNNTANRIVTDIFEKYRLRGFC
jgi:three-Cys-motif partner protein